LDTFKAISCRNTSPNVPGGKALFLVQFTIIYNPLEPIKNSISNDSSVDINQL
jgi:hypothetical protein